MITTEERAAADRHIEADVDQLLARVNRAVSVELSASTWHPSQGTPPPPDSMSTPVVLTVVEGGR